MRILRIVSTSAIAISLCACSGSTSGSSTPEAPTTGTAPGGAQEVARSEPEAGASREPASDSVAAESEEPPPGSPLAKLMREHFKESEVIRSAVIAGKPAAAAQAAASLGSLDDVDKLTNEWRQSIEQMQAAASRVRSSADVAEAAAATADIGVACGACHQKRGGPKTSVGELPASGDSLVSRMARHAWGMERLWEGLYVPSRAAWNAGAKALQEDPFPSDVLKRGGVYGRSAAKDFGSLAAKALKTESRSDRAAVYAGLLRTCATCHIATGRQEQ